MPEIKKLNIYQKIQKARVDLQNKDLKKTGYNKYSNYKYFELGDFLPHINDICNEIGLYTEFSYEEKLATLTIYNTENLEEKRIWTTPVEVATLKGCSTIQNIGGTQSFARRYLYMMAFEIAETDVIDGGAVDEDAELGKQKIGKAHVLTINSLIQETETDKKEFLAWAGVNKVEDITNEAVGTCLTMLNKKKTLKEKREKEELKQIEAEQQQRDFDF
ncbi:ERF family protein [Clostridium perfringens]|uniref:ERF family protein n=1 Tax=Clostridium perfringens TaxID=1502 RepID=UPI0001663FF1|nr:ERF family protein [Clostridium perfringens]EDS79188.1 peptidyl-prolyl cis-trans isomerase family protein [Clostridium perfringens C str. JGS1495]ELC8449541.1 ERF family protein [Clostridium perfringens]MBI6029106.1 ERF family protein [Clostridium perfringens]MBI6067180.1 ERF family protein [Clostridium perfringens]MBI6096111.1 ERF family protein [Clostridium perfringens]